MRNNFKILASALCLFGSAYLECPFAAEHDPAEELASFTIAPGFEVNLFASEKDGVVKPIQMRLDPEGRIWVIGSTVYPQLEPGEVPNDKVLVLEDTDHDGKCDKTTVFADGLMIPTGIELGDGGVYLGHGTELLFLKDTNGDLKADERRVVLRGFGTGDNHQNINSFLWGPGGELWFCQGLHTHSNVETPWGIVRMNQAGLWRLRPKLKKLESFYGAGHEPQNPWGYVFTDWGEPIVIAGNNSSMIYPVPGLTSRHFDLAPHLIWKNGGGRKSSGADIVGTTHFPEDWQGVVITGGYINNAVWALEIQDDGAGFALVDRDPLIKSSSRNFRPVDVKFGPDGSLYICDWYNPIIGHYQASFRHPDRDKNHGRIWRVTAKGRELTPRPKLAGATIEELLGQLKSKDRWTRQFAKRALADRDSKEVAAAVEKWRAEARPGDHALKEGLGVLQSHESVNEPLVRELAMASDPGARAYAASAVGRWADRLNNPMEVLSQLAADPEPRVRLHAIVASSYIPKWEALEIAAKAAQLPTDKFIDYAIRQAVYALKPLWLAAGRTGQFVPGADEKYIKLFLKAGEIKEVYVPAQEYLNSAVEIDKKLSVGRALIGIADTAELDWLITLKDEELRRQLAPEALQAVRQRKLKPGMTMERTLRGYIRRRDPTVMRFAGLWQIDSLRSEIEKAVSETNQPEDARIAAIEAVGGWKDDKSKAMLTELARRDSMPPREQTAAILALAGIDLEEAVRLAIASSLNSERWSELFRGFLQRQGGAAALAKVFGESRPGAAIAEAGMQVMNETGRRDEALAKVLWGVLNPVTTTKLTLGDVPDLVTEVRNRGNAARGEGIYRRVELGCVNCHAVKGQGGTIGPDLGAVGTAQPVDFIIGAILDPQREVKEGFMSEMISTKDGEDYQGNVIKDDAKEVVLRDALMNEAVTIPKGRIQQRRQSGSVMPAGLVDGLTRQEFVDLVRYLSELGR